MSTATLTRSGKVEIPADILARHGLKPGARLEVVDEGSSIRLIVPNERPASDPQAGYGMFKAKPRAVRDSGPRNLSEFDPASLLANPERP
jgi:bifunctional DNA-binding transcriptional regulator/antitoxin component of YhaV-PrlF toxin-antitoxin module